MSVGIDIDRLSELTGMPYIKRSWLDYDLGFNARTQRGKKEASELNSGLVINYTNNSKRNLSDTLHSIIKGRWKYVDFWTGFIAFCLKKIKHLITYEPIESKTISAGPRCRELIFPEWSRELLEKIFEMDISFEDYVRAVGNIKTTFFDVQSAIDVYHLQGDDAILGILAQMFWSGSRRQEFSILLIPGLNIEFVPELSDFVSGVVFPCAVSPMVENIRWEERDNGWFLLGDDYVLDVAQVGHYGIHHSSLGNRLSFTGRGGLSNHLICYNWGDIIDAVKYFGGDILVRSLSEKLLDADWHRFGLGGLVSVFYFQSQVYGHGSKRKGSKKIPCHYRYGEGRVSVVMNLAGQRIKNCDEKEVVYSIGELEDWFELAELCK